MRGLEEALASQAADRSEQGAASAARQQDLARGQADARKALACLKEELAAAQAALQEEHSRCVRLQSNQAAAQQVTVSALHESSLGWPFSLLAMSAFPVAMLAAAGSWDSDCSCYVRAGQV